MERKERKVLKRLCALMLVPGLIMSNFCFDVMAIAKDEIASDATITGKQVKVEGKEAGLFSYDIRTAAVIENGKFKEIRVTHVSETDAVSKTLSETAVKGVNDFLKGKPATFKSVESLDAVTNATISTEAIKSSLMDALGKADAAKTQAPENDEKPSEDSIYKADGKLKNGTYSVDAETDSSMFAVTDGKLIVEDDRMEAIITLKGTGFDKIYMGSAKEAASANEEDIIGSMPGITDATESKRTFWNIPVESLDKNIVISARSSRKRRWYDHTINFKSKNIQRISTNLERPSIEQNAQKFMYQNFIDEKIFANNADVITVSQGVNYTVPFFDKDETTEISSIKFKQSSDKNFKLGWHVSNWDIFSTKKRDLHAASTKAFRIKDRSEGDVNFDVKLKIYDANNPKVNRSSIMEDTAPSIGEKLFHIRLKGAPAPVDVNFSVKDVKTGNTIDNPVVKIEAPDGTSVIPNTKGKYTLKVGVKYKLQISAPGYLDKDGNEKISETLRVTSAGTIEKKMLAEKDSKHKVKFRIKDESGQPIKDAKLELTHSASNQKVEADPDGSYTLKDNQDYRYTVSAEGYISKKDIAAKVTEDKDFDISLKSNIKIYKAKFWMYSLATHDEYKGEYKLSVFSKNGEEKNFVEQGKDEKYPLKRDVKYFCEVEIENHYMTKYTELPAVFNGDEEDVEVRVVIDETDDYKLGGAIAGAKEYLEKVKVGEKPSEYPAEAKAELEKELAAAEAVLANQSATSKDKESAMDKLNSAVRICKNKQNFAEIEVKVVTHINTETKYNAAPQVMNLKVRGDECKKYGYQKSGIESRRNVTPLDVAYAVHEKLYGEEFKKNPKKYLTFDYKDGRMFGNGKNVRFFIAVDNKSVELLNLEKKIVPDGATVLISTYPSKEKHTVFLHFKDAPKHIYTGEEIVLHLLGGEIESIINKYDKAQPGYSVTFENTKTKEIVESKSTSDENGELKMIFQTAGTYRITGVGNKDVKSVLIPELEIVVKADKPSLNISMSKDGINAGNEIKLKDGSDTHLIYTQKKSKGAALSVTDGNFANFVEPYAKVTVDGAVLKQGRDYEAREGSIIVNLLPSYLENLKPGVHVVRVYERNGYAEGIIEIAKATEEVKPVDNGNKAGTNVTYGVNNTDVNKAKTSVNTGDTNNYKLWIGLGAAAVVAAIILTTLGRKKKK